MRAELLPGMTNVVRFPVERRARPTLELLREIAPDVREVLAMADALGVEAPDPRLRDEADAEMAEWIVNQVPPAGPERAAMPAGCREEALVRAISACRAVHDASLQLAAARLTLVRAQTKGGHWIAPLRERVDRADGAVASHRGRAGRGSGRYRARGRSCALRPAVDVLRRSGRDGPAERGARCRGLTCPGCWRRAPTTTAWSGKVAASMGCTGVGEHADCEAVSGQSLVLSDRPIQ